MLHHNQVVTYFKIHEMKYLNPPKVMTIKQTELDPPVVIELQQDDQTQRELASKEAWTYVYVCACV